MVMPAVQLNHYGYGALFAEEIHVGGEEKFLGRKSLTGFKTLSGMVYFKTEQDIKTY